LVGKWDMEMRKAEKVRRETTAQSEYPSVHEKKTASGEKNVAGRVGRKSQHPQGKWPETQSLATPRPKKGGNDQGGGEGR